MKKLLITLTLLLSQASLAETHFKTGSADPELALISELQKLYTEKIEGKNIEKVVVVGHTDVRGSEQSNQKLSEERAYSAAKLLSVMGLDSVKSKFIGAGENEPVSSGITEIDHAMNRRVVVTVYYSNGTTDKTVISEDKKSECKPVEKTVIQKEEANKNIISAYLVNSQNGLEKSNNGSAVEVSAKQGVGVGAMYQRRFERIYVGGMIDTNGNAGLSVGLGF